MVKAMSHVCIRKDIHSVANTDFLFVICYSTLPQKYIMYVYVIRGTPIYSIIL